MIVEDEAIVAESLKEFLEDEGYAITAVVDSGEEAIQTMSRIDANLIVMDIRLRGELDGIETASLIHQTWKQVPILFLTAYGVDLIPHTSNISPVLCRYVSKPYDQDKLKNDVKELLSSAS